METAAEIRRNPGRRKPSCKALRDIAVWRPGTGSGNLLSGCRAMSGVNGYVRAGRQIPILTVGCGLFLSWRIDAASGLPIKERGRVLRWFCRMGDELIWDDSRAELAEEFDSEAQPKNVTFIPASVHDKPHPAGKRSHYLSNLRALPRIDRERLLGGNWNVQATAGSYFRREMGGGVKVEYKTEFNEDKRRDKEQLLLKFRKLWEMDFATRPRTRFNMNTTEQTQPN